MRFINRETQFPGRRRLQKVDANNVPIQGEEDVLVKIMKDEGAVYVNGTVVDAETLNKGNWRDDDNVSFRKMDNNNLPAPMTMETQIVTKANGETWIVPPTGLGDAKEITDPTGSVVKVDDIKTNVCFTSDPQYQIDDLKTALEGSAVTVASHGTRIDDLRAALDGSTNIILADVSAAAWTADPDNSDYPYKCTLPIPGAVSSMVPMVMFSDTDARSGRYSPVCESGTDAVYIWSKTNIVTTVPRVVLIR